MQKRILLTGVNGQVGHALSRAFAMYEQSPYEVIGLDRNQLDLSDKTAIRRVVQDIQPEVIINPAAYTMVDKAESEAELAYAINATAPRVLAEEAAKMGARLIHFSTDYVYAGVKSAPYIEEDQTQPLSVYGKSKLAGEDAIHAVGVPHLIFRTSWVYGAYGKNFMKTILRLGAERDELRIVADQFGAPTSSSAIAEAILSVMARWDSALTGTYHLVNAGQTSWHGFAIAIVQEYNRIQQAHHLLPLKVSPENIHAISTQEYPTPAARPANSCLDCSKLARDFRVTLPDWRAALVFELLKLT
ncbi:MAG: dTDP-4-dehydrorhamnose reductase [Betaproteobacteria bacterium HGW-Betaproteobacteria-22]|nr:MAG: dTDP-4-dehydrorhamnose reductase [Betaproteobacteria bacterium HGW-Betaproteobacteria-22]